MDRKEHWENVYTTKKVTEVSWYQPHPSFTLQLIAKHCSSKSDAIIDIGGGDSFLPDYLLEEGYSDVSVLDISSKAIERAQNRLELNAKDIHWIVSDVTDFTPSKKYKIWYDRAAFHFLSGQKEIEQYVQVMNEATDAHSISIIGAFSPKGPLKCSGIEITQYDEAAINKVFGAYFSIFESHNINHTTPSGSIQNFNFFVLKKKD